MKTVRGLLCFVLLVVGVGCQTFPKVERIEATPIVPQGNEQIIRDQLIVLVDASGSIGSSRNLFAFEKSLVEAFTQAMPDGDYLSGITSFAGVESHRWVKVPLSPFSRDAMVSGAADLEGLGLTTPLERAIRSLEPEFAGKGGRGALLIFSDGRVTDPAEVLEACKELMAAHGGRLCIFAVWIDSAGWGRRVLRDMVLLSGCGKFYEASTLDSPEAIQALARDIFFGPEGSIERAAAAIHIILFDNDSAVVAPMYDAELDEMAGLLKANPSVRLLLEGHTDSNAPEQYNQKLSERRVAAVKAALVKRGASGSQLKTRAYGELEPAVPNDSPENMHRNRRVELSIIK